MVVRRQYERAKYAIALAGSPQKTHVVPGAAGPQSTRETALVSALMASSHSVRSHHAALTNPR
jgi:hypothetical protein